MRRQDEQQDLVDGQTVGNNDTEADLHGRHKTPGSRQVDRLVATTTAAAGVTTAAASVKRLTDWQPSWTFGEHFVGTSNDERIYAPWNLGDQQAVAQVSLNGAGFTLESPAQFTLLPSTSSQVVAFQESYAPLIRFAPAKSGVFTASMTLVVTWPDGHSETRSMKLTASARDLDDVTKRGELPDAGGIGEKETKAAAAAGETLTAAADGKEVDRGDDKAFDAAVRRAAQRASLLAGQEERGVGIAEKEVDHYQREVVPEEPSVWWSVLDIALTMAVGGLAGALAKKLGPKLAKTMSEALKPGATGEAASAGVKSAVSTLTDFTTDATKEGMKGVAKKVIGDAAKPAKKKEKHGKPKERSGHSADGQIDFFAQQASVIASAGTGYYDLVEKRAADLQPLLALAPEQAIAAMTDIGDAFEESSQDAKDMHANAAAIQWVSLVARSNLGADEITDENLAPGVDPDRVTDVTTDLSSARKASSNPKKVDGLLDIWVDETSGKPMVKKVRLNGISYSVIQRMMDVPLGELRVPMRFNVAAAAHSDKRSVVTVDEALRVRADGDFAALGAHVGRKNNAPATSEIDAYQGTTAFVDTLLTETLSSFSVKVEDDDARGDVK